MRTYTINGNKCSTKKAFYKHTEMIFTSNLGWETGRNLYAFADILSGGFGGHEYGEKITVEWTNLQKSKEKLPPNFFDEVIHILEKAEHVVFKKYDYSK